METLVRKELKQWIVPSKLGSTGLEHALAALRAVWRRRRVVQPLAPPMSGLQAAVF
jgi:hypothetical protein